MVPMNPMSEEELKFIAQAKAYLEHPSWMIRIVNMVGQPIEIATKKLPVKIQGTIAKASNTALTKALKVSLKTVPARPGPALTFSQMVQGSNSSKWQHTAGASVAGAAGGFFGMLSLPLELPVTTGIMLRSIVNAGRVFGFDQKDPRFHAECLYVFTLGGPSKGDDAMDTSYYTSRVGLERVIQQAAAFLAEHNVKSVLEGVSKGTAPVLLRFISTIAARFEVAVSEKMLASAVPVVGALGGAAVNAAFADHFARAAHFHFGLQYLEGKYSRDTVMAVYAKA